jgi:hypothetical protein
MPVALTGEQLPGWPYMIHLIVTHDPRIKDVESADDSQNDDYGKDHLFDIYIR